MLVCQFWSPEAFDILVVVCDAQFGWTSLNLAVKNGHTSTVALLLEHGASVNHAEEVSQRFLFLCSAAQALLLVRAFGLIPVVSVVLPMRQSPSNGYGVLLRSLLTRRSLEHCCGNVCRQDGRFIEHLGFSFWLTCISRLPAVEACVGCRHVSTIPLCMCASHKCTVSECPVTGGVSCHTLCLELLVKSANRSQISVLTS